MRVAQFRHLTLTRLSCLQCCACKTRRAATRPTIVLTFDPHLLLVYKSRLSQLDPQQPDLAAGSAMCVQSWYALYPEHPGGASLDDGVGRKSCVNPSST